MVALDVPSVDEANRLVQLLDGIPCWLKVGMELFYAAGPEFVRELKRRGYRVFVDLKLHDIPNTVKGGAASLTRLGADMFNVHAAGGLAMMEAAAAGARQAVTDGGGRPLVIAVTQLTSTSQATMNDEIGIAGSVEQSVLRYAGLAKRAGLDGVVCSALEARAIKTACGDAFRTVTPGIRPSGSPVGDQARVMTPAEALGEGADYLVIGRAVTAAPDPRAALESIIKELLHT